MAIASSVGEFINWLVLAAAVGKASAVLSNIDLGDCNFCSVSNCCDTMQRNAIDRLDVLLATLHKLEIVTVASELKIDIL